ncbi:MAG: hypothetical protein EBZ58_13680 [Bacteroidetes bacterium]|nr:hypothetical protein [Bacteroidota bacterium]
MIWHYKTDSYIRMACFQGLALLFSTKLQNFVRFRTNLGIGYFDGIVNNVGSNISSKIYKRIRNPS